MNATLRDVANAAGVSVMSACAVLTGGGRNVKVSEKTATLIREKAKELNYEPNLLGRGLRTRKTDTIGVVLEHLTSFGDEPYYYQQLLDGIMIALFPHGYSLSLSPTLVQSGGKVRISNGRFDGILWCSPDLIATSIESVKSLRMPVVMVHAPAEVALGLPTFAADNERAMHSIVNLLVSLGHKSIGYVVKPHVSISVEAKARMSAFLQAAEGLGARGEILLWEYDAKDLERYASDAPPHTALVAFNDVHASHILLRAMELGIRVPQDLSVVGFDSSSLCERTHPRLTSVHQPIELIAGEATQCLLRLISADPEGASGIGHDSKLYNCRLDIRDSTASPHPRRRGI